MTKYEIIERGDGMFFPRMTNIKTGTSYGAWNGYRKTYGEALKDLNGYIDKCKEEDELRKEKVVYSFISE
jgi:hypothetical protein